MLGANASKEQIAAENHKLGYDKPLPQQYLHYVGGLAHGDLQMSLRTRRNVTTDLGAYLPATLELALFGLGLALVLGAVLGLATASKARGSGVLRFLMVGGAPRPPSCWPSWASSSSTGTSTGSRPPAHVVPRRAVGPHRAPHRGRARARKARPVVGRRAPPHPPGVLRGDPPRRVDRPRPALQPDHDHADRLRPHRSAKGLRETVVLFKHALRNSIGPALSMTGLQVGLMFAGVVVIEQIFAWPGIGLYTVQSIPAPTSRPSRA